MKVQVSLCFLALLLLLLVISFVSVAEAAVIEMPISFMSKTTHRSLEYFTKITSRAIGLFVAVVGLLTNILVAMIWRIFLWPQTSSPHDEPHAPEKPDTKPSSQPEVIWERTNAKLTSANDWLRLAYSSLLFRLSGVYSYLLSMKSSRDAQSVNRAVSTLPPSLVSQSARRYINSMPAGKIVSADGPLNISRSGAPSVPGCAD